jgi:hypothetical protein
MTLIWIATGHVVYYIFLNNNCNVVDSELCDIILSAVSMCYLTSMIRLSVLFIPLGDGRNML